MLFHSSFVPAFFVLFYALFDCISPGPVLSQVSTSVNLNKLFSFFMAQLVFRFLTEEISGCLWFM